MKVIATADWLATPIGLVATAPALANPAALAIDDVQVAGSHMEIRGKQFDSGPLSVSIAGVGELRVRSATNTMIETVLPPNLEGTYLLDVLAGTTNKQNAEFALKLGQTL